MTSSDVFYLARKSSPNNLQNRKIVELRLIFFTLELPEFILFFFVDLSLITLKKAYITIAFNCTSREKLDEFWLS